MTSRRKQTCRPRRCGRGERNEIGTYVRAFRHRFVHVAVGLLVRWVLVVVVPRRTVSHLKPMLFIMGSIEVLEIPRIRADMAHVSLERRALELLALALAHLLAVHPPAQHEEPALPVRRLTPTRAWARERDRARTRCRYA